MDALKVAVTDAEPLALTLEVADGDTVTEPDSVVDTVVLSDSETARAIGPENAKNIHRARSFMLHVTNLARVVCFLHRRISIGFIFLPFKQIDVGMGYDGRESLRAKAMDSVVP